MRRQIPKFNTDALQRDAANVVITRGDSFSLEVAVFYPDGTVTGLPGSQGIYWVLAKSVGEAPILIKELGDGIELDDEEPNVFVVSIDPEDTRELDRLVYWPEFGAATVNTIDKRSIETSYYHEAKIVNADGDVFTVLSGRVFVRESSIPDPSELENS